MKKKFTDKQIHILNVAEKLIAKKGFEGPVSVKTRVGYNTVDMTWIEGLLKQNLAALTIHARTRKEMSDVPARWEHVREVVELRNKIAPQTKIIGNGDANSREDAFQKIKESGADGAMIGRGIFGNPWFFSGHIPTITEKLNVLVEHTKLFHELLGSHKNFAIMKKHYKAYVHGWDGAKELRVKLMETNTPEEVEKIIKDYILYL